MASTEAWSLRSCARGDGSGSAKPRTKVNRAETTIGFDIKASRLAMTTTQRFDSINGVSGLPERLNRPCEDACDEGARRATI
jgi:hypothetical protein